MQLGNGEVATGREKNNGRILKAVDWVVKEVSGGWLKATAGGDWCSSHWSEPASSYCQGKQNEPDESWNWLKVFFLWLAVGFHSADFFGG